MLQDIGRYFIITTLCRCSSGNRTVGTNRTCGGWLAGSRGGAYNTVECNVSVNAGIRWWPRLMTAHIVSVLFAFSRPILSTLIRPLEQRGTWNDPTRTSDQPGHKYLQVALCSSDIVRGAGEGGQRGFSWEIKVAWKMLSFFSGGRTIDNDFLKYSNLSIWPPFLVDVINENPYLGICELQFKSILREYSFIPKTFQIEIFNNTTDSHK